MNYGEEGVDEEDDDFDDEEGEDLDILEGVDNLLDQANPPQPSNENSNLARGEANEENEDDYGDEEAIDEEDS